MTSDWSFFGRLLLCGKMSQLEDVNVNEVGGDFGYKVLNRRP